MGQKRQKKDKKGRFKPRTLPSHAKPILKWVISNQAPLYLSAPCFSMKSTATVHFTKQTYSHLQAKKKSAMAKLRTSRRRRRLNKPPMPMFTLCSAAKSDPVQEAVGQGKEYAGQY